MGLQSGAAMDVSEPNPEFFAARLALLALRASVSDSSALAADRVVLGDAPLPLSTEEAAQRLAAMPKPLFCEAEAREGMLVVRYRSLWQAEVFHQQLYEMTRRDHAQYGGFMGFLEEQYGPGDHLVSVSDGNDSIIVPHSVVQCWLREYFIDAAGYSADDIDNPWSANDPGYLEARRRGAKGILSFSSAVTPSYFSAVSSKGDELATSEAEDHWVKMARMNHGLLRCLIDSAADSAAPAVGQWQREQLSAAKDHLMHNCEMLKQVFKSRECREMSLPSSKTARSISAVRSSWIEQNHLIARRTRPRAALALSPASRKDYRLVGHRPASLKKLKT